MEDKNIIPIGESRIVSEEYSVDSNTVNRVPDYCDWNGQCKILKEIKDLENSEDKMPFNLLLNGPLSWFTMCNRCGVIYDTK